MIIKILLLFMTSCVFAIPEEQMLYKQDTSQLKEFDPVEIQFSLPAGMTVKKWSEKRDFPQLTFRESSISVFREIGDNASKAFLVKHIESTHKLLKDYPFKIDIKQKVIFKLGLLLGFFGVAKPLFDNFMLKQDFFNFFQFFGGIGVLTLMRYVKVKEYRDEMVYNHLMKMYDFTIVSSQKSSLLKYHIPFCMMSLAEPNTLKNFDSIISRFCNHYFEESFDDFNLKYNELHKSSTLMEHANLGAQFKFTIESIE